MTHDDFDRNISPAILREITYVTKKHARIDSAIARRKEISFADESEPVLAFEAKPLIDENFMPTLRDAVLHYLSTEDNATPDQIAKYILNHFRLCYGLESVETMVKETLRRLMRVGGGKALIKRKVIRSAKNVRFSVYYLVRPNSKYLLDGRYYSAAELAKHEQNVHQLSERTIRQRLADGLNADLALSTPNKRKGAGRKSK